MADPSSNLTYNYHLLFSQKTSHSGSIEVISSISSFWEDYHIKKLENNQCKCLWCNSKFSIYDIYFEKIYSIDDEDIHFVKVDGYALIGDPDHTYGISTDHEYFFICDDLFYRILKTDQNSDIALKVIHKEVSFSSINHNSTDSRSKLRSRSDIFSPRHQIQRKRQKNFNIIHINPLTISS